MLTDAEIDRMTQKVYMLFGKKIGLPIDKVKKCVRAISALNDIEIEQRLKKLL
ncbi:MAG TPA: hypothetical protein VHR47_01245 [Bacillota bacterium]|nr:hypothetical protein [Bacillota bacterium]